MSSEDSQAKSSHEDGWQGQVRARPQRSGKTMGSEDSQAKPGISMAGKRKCAPAAARGQPSGWTSAPGA